MATKKAKAWTFEAVSTKAVIVGLHLVGYIPVYIACDINYHASVSQGPAWAWVSVCFTIAAAILIEAAIIAFTRRLVMAGLALAVLALPLLALNTFTASGNAAATDAHTREVHQKQEKTAENRGKRRKDTEELRDQNKRLAGGETEASAQSKIDVFARDNPSDWKRTKGCTVKSAGFCDDVIRLRGKMTAAHDYAKALTDLAALDEEDVKTDVGVQSTAEGASANLAMMASALGHPLTKEASEKVFEWVRGANLELVAGVGPGLHGFRCVAAVWRWCQDGSLVVIFSET